MSKFDCEKFEKCIYAAGETKSSVARNIRCGVDTIISYCKGRRAPKAEILCDACDFLGVPMETFFRDRRIFTTGR